MQEYEDYYYNNVNEPDSIFQLQGLTILTFTQKKIKFAYTPKDIINYISRKIIFYCSIRYIHGRWMIMRNSLPVNIQSIIYSQFFNARIVDLDHIVHVVTLIYDILIKWSKEYENFRRKKREVRIFLN